MTDDNLKLFSDWGLNLGRLIGMSKTLYRNEHPTHEVYYNANVFTKNGKIWYGDLDLFYDAAKLEEIAKQVGTLYVLREMDGRFENEERTEDELKAVAVKIYE